MLGGRLGQHRRTIGLVALATCARGLYWLSTLDYTPISDAASYNAIAVNFAEGRGLSDVFPQIHLHETAFRPPLFPMLLGSVYKVFGTSVGLGRLLNVVIGVVLVLLVERLGTSIGGSRAGLVAAVAVAVYPPLVVNDVTILAESLALLLLVLVVMSSADQRWVIAGVETGLLVLTRHSAQAFPLVIAVMFVVWIGWQRALGYLLVCATVLTPWIIRNQLQLGAPVLNTANGFNVAAIYSPEAHETGGFVDAVFDPRFDDLRRQQLDEVDWDAALRTRGLDGLRQHPLDLVHVVGGNTLAYLEIKPWQSDGAEQRDGRNKTVRRVALPLFYAVTIVGMSGLWMKRRNRAAQVLIASATYFTLASIVFLGVPRLRGPFDLACCIGVGLLVGKLSERNRVREPELARSRASADVD